MSVNAQSKLILATQEIIKFGKSNSFDLALKSYQGVKSASLGIFFVGIL